MKPAKPHKYGAQRTECSSGHSHPSKAEARRCGELHLLQRLGEINSLQVEPAFPIEINGKKVFTYRADFSYFDGKTRTPFDEMVVEDVKGHLTPVYRLKKKCVEAFYPGLKIVEVK